MHLLQCAVGKQGNPTGENDVDDTKDSANKGACYVEGPELLTEHMKKFSKCPWVRKLQMSMGPQRSLARPCSD